MGKALARFFGGLFILGATIGAGTIGVAVLSSAAATVITVNDASDPVVDQYLPAIATRTPRATAPCGRRWRKPHS